jgi:uncharacterized protein
LKTVTLDSNVWVSALEFGGVPKRVVQAALDGDVEIAVSQWIIDETLRILKNKFGWSRSDLVGALMVIEDCTTIVSPSETPSLVADDPDDDNILACAAAAKSNYLLTGDKHLLKLGSYRDTEIIKPAQFFETGCN